MTPSLCHDVGRAQTIYTACESKQRPPSPAMAKKLLRRLLPNSDTLRAHRSLRLFARWLHHPSLWHINRRGVAVGVAIGLFWAFVPMPLQMVPATAMALLLRANIPAAILGAWVTNPFTMGPAILLCYRIGAWILGVTHEITIEMSWRWVTDELALVWEPFLLGCFVVGVTASALGYFGVQLFWRCHVARAWRRRKRKRQEKARA
ncbi:MAG TPA: DUF2062 domain-containing protein [Burkholderiaceae bacterium]|nr:DUF2062 domain-containing protein [Burkholderiaceae bacterium]